MLLAKPLGIPFKLYGSPDSIESNSSFKALLFLVKELKNKIRSIIVNDDKNLPTFSYSKIEVYKNCPMQYKIKYIDKKYSSDTSLALELGSLCHYVLEQKGKTITAKKEVDYDKLVEILHSGVIETDEKTKECLLGIDSLKKKYLTNLN